MDLSIIIVSFNTKDFLRKCLFSISQQLFDLSKVIIVDNRSVDGTPVMIRKDFPSARLIVSKNNAGFAAACNQGAKIARGEILFFLNPDTLIKENIFSKLFESFKQNSKVGVVAPKVILPDGSPQPWAYGKEEGLWQLIKNKFYQSPNQLTGLDWVSGAALAIRRNIFEKIGGFDENFFMYFEDRDLCQRVKQLGYKIIVLSQAKVIHFGGRSSSSNRTQKEMYYQSQNYYWRKYHGLALTLLMRLIRWPYKFYILNIQR